MESQELKELSFHLFLGPFAKIWAKMNFSHKSDSVTF